MSASKYPAPSGRFFAAPGVVPILAAGVMRIRGDRIYDEHGHQLGRIRGETRIVDLYGYVSVDTNRYSAPERLVGQAVRYPSSGLKAYSSFFSSRVSMESIACQACLS